MTPTSVAPQPRIEQLISEHFDALSVQQQRAARYILAHPDDVALHSMRQVAVEAKLPAVTFVRLARALGLPDYQSFRALFHDRVRSGDAGQRYASKARAIQNDSAGSHRLELTQKLFDADIENIHSVYQLNDEATLLAAVALLEKAARVFVLGQRSCYPAAFLFHYVSRLFRQNVILVSGAAGIMLDDLRGITSGDVLLSISVEPYSNEVVRVVRNAKMQGVKSLVITDSSLSPLARASDVSLITATNTPSFFHSVTGLTTIVQSLLALMVSRGGEQTLAAIEESEAELDRFGAYWADGRSAKD